MKQKRFITTVILSAILFIACSNNNVKSSGKEDNPTSTSSGSGDSTYSGDNSFAYTINGHHISIKDFMHDGDGKNWMALFLNEVKNNADNGMIKVEVTNELTKEVFKLSVANSGSSTINHSSTSLSNFAYKKSNEATYMSSGYKNYYGDSVTVSITAINATRVSGKFSGKFLSDDNKPIPLEITDGSFDVAFTKDN